MQPLMQHSDVHMFMCPQRLQSKVLKLVDVSYGGENGFNQVSLFKKYVFILIVQFFVFMYMYMDKEFNFVIILSLISGH